MVRKGASSATAHTITVGSDTFINHSPTLALTEANLQEADGCVLRQRKQSGTSGSRRDDCSHFSALHSGDEPHSDEGAQAVDHDNR